MRPYHFNWDYSIMEIYAPPEAPVKKMKRSDFQVEDVKIIKVLNYKYESEIKKAAEIRLRIIWPSYPTARFMCVSETFDMLTSWIDVKEAIFNIHDVKGPWMRERGRLLLSHATEMNLKTLKDLEFVDGDTLCLECDQCFPYLIHALSEYMK